MLATKGVEELLHKEPLLWLIDGADELLEALDQLRAVGFRDGFEEVRQRASRINTWDDRAAAMIDGLDSVF